MGKQTTCCFTGHRTVDKYFNPELIERLAKKLILEKGVDTFIAGGALGFDTLCEKAILKLKKEFPHIQLHIYAPCNNQTAKWRACDIEIYNDILSKADYVDMPYVSYFNGCMKIRNYKMVDNSAFCICYLNQPGSGTGQTVAYAKRCGLELYNLADSDE